MRTDWQKVPGWCCWWRGISSSCTWWTHKSAVKSQVRRVPLISNLLECIATEGRGASNYRRLSVVWPNGERSELGGGGGRAIIRIKIFRQLGSPSWAVLPLPRILTKWRDDPVPCHHHQEERSVVILLLIITKVKSPSEARRPFFNSRFIVPCCWWL